MKKKEKKNRKNDKVKINNAEKKKFVKKEEVKESDFLKRRIVMLKTVKIAIDRLRDRMLGP